MSAAIDIQNADLRDNIKRVNTLHKKRVFGLVAAAVIIISYSIITWQAYDFSKAFARWDSQSASIFVLDTYANKDHVVMIWDKPEKVDVVFEGSKLQKYSSLPDWIVSDSNGHVVTFESGKEVILKKGEVILTGFGDAGEEFVITRNDDGQIKLLGYDKGDGDIPDFIRWSKTKIEVKPNLFERVQVLSRKVEVHRYQYGWRYFWFDFESEFRDMSLTEAISYASSAPQIKPGYTNTQYLLREIWTNNIWFHGTVIMGCVETVFMALMGTLIASFVAFPLAFLAAKNINPIGPLRFSLRRLFDFLRGVDMLIWSLIFLRAFGPGMFTAIFSIAFTDTGTLGKLMSEAIENSDDKQKEGVASTGGSRSASLRFGIIPQILPVFVSQSLYYLESNTRAAVIIGAMGAGGIGQQFISALRTGRDFEDVAYIALWVLFIVISMDILSGMLRKRLIQSQ